MARCKTCNQRLPESNLERESKEHLDSWIDAQRDGASSATDAAQREARYRIELNGIAGTQVRFYDDKELRALCERMVERARAALREG